MDKKGFDPGFALVVAAIAGLGLWAFYQSIQVSQMTQAVATLAKKVEALEQPLGSPATPQQNPTDAAGKAVPKGKAALSLVGPCDASAETADQPLDQQSQSDLGLEDYLNQEYVLARICVDAPSGRAAFIMARNDAPLDAKGNQTCVGDCDADIFGTIDLKSGGVNAKPATSKLGIYSGTHDRTCLIDKVIPSALQTKDLILFYCGSGAGAMTDWYQYAMENDQLTKVQSISTLKPETFGVARPDLLSQFRYVSNAAMKK